MADDATDSLLHSGRTDIALISAMFHPHQTAVKSAGDTTCTILAGIVVTFDIT